MQSALNVIEAKADFDSPERSVYVRVGELDGRVYLDLCDDDWRVVEIDAAGWRVLADAPVRFRRAAGMKPLPTPLPGGSIEELRNFINVKSERDFVLAVAFLLAALRPAGPYPLIVTSGEHGSAKSTFCRILKELVDPNTAPLRTLPREDRDLFIAANNGHVLAFDNVSSLSTWLSDAFCRLSTGGGYAKRQLYADQDEVLFDGLKPLILNGIEDIVTRPDLADRSLPLVLEAIPEDKRRSEEELRKGFEIARPRIIGALLDAMVTALANLGTVRLESLPRMADFAIWIVACEPALWRPRTLLSAYDANREDAVSDVIESDVVAIAVRKFMTTRQHQSWSGTATDLLDTLNGQRGSEPDRSKDWPVTATLLSGKLRRIAPLLRKVGTDIRFERNGKERSRTIYISSRPEIRVQTASAVSASSADGPIGDRSTVANMNDAPIAGDLADGADATTPEPGDKRKDAPAWKARIMTTKEVIAPHTPRGIEVSLDGENLQLIASAEPPDSVVETLRSYKTDIIELLKTSGARFTCDSDQPPQPAYVSTPAAPPEKEQGLSWAEWKARELNRHFQGQGVAGQPGKITAETVLDGLEKTTFRSKTRHLGRR